MKMKERIKEFLRLYNEGQNEAALELIAAVFHEWIQEDAPRFSGIGIEELLGLSHYYAAIARNLRLQAERVFKEERSPSRQDYLTGVDGLLGGIAERIATISFQMPEQGEE